MSPGFGQGIRRSVFSTAAILGPLWAGGTVSFSYYVLLGVPCGLLLFVTVCLNTVTVHFPMLDLNFQILFSPPLQLLLLLSFSKLKEPKSPLTPPSGPKITTSNS